MVPLAVHGPVTVACAEVAVRIGTPTMINPAIRMRIGLMVSRLVSAGEKAREARGSGQRPPSWLPCAAVGAPIASAYMSDAPFSRQVAGDPATFGLDPSLVADLIAR